MPPPLLFDLNQIDPERIILSKDQIYDLLPHRFEFALLDAICHIDVDTIQITGFVDVKPDTWWARGHIPGRPMLPGVLMLEMAAQLAATLAKSCGGYDNFIGYGGVDDCRFREAVTPPARLYLLGQGLEHRPRRFRSAVQGVMDGRLVFEATVTGLVMK